MTMLSYSCSLYQSKGLGEIAREYYKAIPKDVKYIVTMGTSGCSLATAILMVADRELFHVSFRKEGESAHSSKYAGEINGAGSAVIVDDFIATGETVQKIMACAKAQNVKIKAVIMHHRLFCHGGEDYINSLKSGGIEYKQLYDE